MHNRYDGSKSSSYMPDGRKVDITNDELSLKGFLSTDTFHVSLFYNKNNFIQ